MAKIIAPPQIANLEEVIAVLTDPKKYAELAQQLKTMQDAINERLGALNKKEQMDEFVAASEQRAAATKEEAAQMSRAAVKQREEADALMAKAKEHLQEAETVRADAEKQRAALADIGQQRAASEEYAARLNARAKDLDEREQTIKENYRRMEQLDVLLQQRKNALDMDELRLRDALKRVEV